MPDAPDTPTLPVDPKTTTAREAFQQMAVASAYLTDEGWLADATETDTSEQYAELIEAVQTFIGLTYEAAAEADLQPQRFVRPNGEVFDEGHHTTAVFESRERAFRFLMGLVK
ncbi:hypothetical protein ACFC1T_08805 [Kitasatospora sp. NPDC056076]|uniref:hypothetical protein n=1 Tax=Kitasatospora sp. NPDC056076 TaxID=3345703 RepID=UPI0035D9083A